MYYGFFSMFTSLELRNTCHDPGNTTHTNHSVRESVKETWRLAGTYYEFMFDYYRYYIVYCYNIFMIWFVITSLDLCHCLTDRGFVHLATKQRPTGLSLRANIQAYINFSVISMIIATIDHSCLIYLFTSIINAHKQTVKLN